MQKRKEASQSTRERVLGFLNDFAKRHGYSPSIREIGWAVGLKSSSTVYNHLRRLKQEGLIAAFQQKPRTLTTSREADQETLQWRVRIDLADGGTIYLDCMVEKPKSAPVAITFGGVLDAKQIKGKVSRVIAFSMEQHDEGQRELNEQHRSEAHEAGIQALRFHGVPPRHDAV